LVPPFKLKTNEKEVEALRDRIERFREQSSKAVEGLQGAVDAREEEESLLRKELMLFKRHVTDPSAAPPSPPQSPTSNASSNIAKGHPPPLP
jgi:hypothetical protein